MQKELPTVYCNGKELRSKDFFVFRHRESFGENQRAAAVSGERGAARRPAPDRRRPRFTAEQKIRATCTI